MSINHFSSELPEAQWWAPPTTIVSSSKHINHSIFSPNSTAATDFRTPNCHPFYHHSGESMAACTQNSAFNFDLNNEDDEELTEDHQMADERENISRVVKLEGAEEGEVMMIPKEPLFEKPLTPSDVGKLNRLVIPKQHAEKYFPLNATNNGNDSGGEKGLLLSFEDELGKPWRFRYSYWNSSQSYVLTKGWSRFVKEKRLDAGDAVLFERHRLDGDRLFIGWRRRRNSSSSTTAAAAASQDGGGVLLAEPAAAVARGGGGGWTRLWFSGHNPYPGQEQGHGHGPALPHQPHCLHAAASVLQSQTMPSANSKRLRLFGVNLECQPDQSDPPTPDGSSSASSLQDQGQGQAYSYHHHYQHQQYYPKVHAYNHHNHMDIDFSRDVNQTRYRQG